MDISDKEDSNTSNTPPSDNSTVVRQKITSTQVCKVCGDSAQYSYYGAIVCQSCKVFFRRNAQTQSIQLKCKSDDNCEININNRRICPSCRFAKCLLNGMNNNMIRSSWTKQTKTNREKKSTTDSQTLTPTALVRLNERYQSAQIPTLNLLRSDQSTLTVEQWNHLSNLVHSFDNYFDFSFIQHFKDEQNALPPKYRFKYTSVSEFFTLMLTKVQLAFEKNRDVISLSLHDRTVLLRTTAEYTTGIGGAFVLQQAHLFDSPMFLETTKLIFRPSTVALIKHLIEQLDPDATLMKILLAIMSFLISNYTTYRDTPTTILEDTKKILFVQDMYAELLWRYLLYKYNHHDAVICFSNIIRCLFLVNDSIVEAHEEQQFRHMIDSVIESTQEKLNLNS